MATKLERIEAKMEEARKALGKATTARDTAIVALGRAADRIKQAGRALGRLEKQRLEARREERQARKAMPAFPDDHATINL